jgi:hypothetical protein
LNRASFTAIRVIARGFRPGSRPSIASLSIFYQFDHAFAQLACAFRANLSAFCDIYQIFPCFGAFPALSPFKIPTCNALTRTLCTRYTRA